MCEIISLTFPSFLGASFAEALGMCTMPQPSKKRHNNSPNLISTKSIKTEPLSPPINNKNTLKSEPEYGESSNVICILSFNIFKIGRKTNFNN